MNIGTNIEKLAKPIAKALKLDCIDASGNLKPESKCAKARDALDEVLYRDAFFDRFFNAARKKTKQ